MKLEKRSLREEIERKDGQIQELRAENELLKIENTTAVLCLHKFSLSQVSLLGSMYKKVAKVAIKIMSISYYCHHDSQNRQITVSFYRPLSSNGR